MKVITGIVVLIILAFFFIDNPNPVLAILGFFIIAGIYSSMTSKYKRPTKRRKLRTKSIVRVPQTRVTKSEEYVYIIKDIEISGYYKIGKTTNLDQRMNLFSVKLPFKFEIIHVITTSNCTTTEKWLHDKYASKRKNGEWFDLNARDISYLKTLNGLK